MPGGGDVLGLGGGNIGPDIGDAGNMVIDTAPGPGVEPGALGGVGNLFGGLAERLGFSSGAPGGLGAGSALGGGGFSDWLSGAFSPDQIAAMSQQQEQLLQQWAQIIPPSDPRWPQVLQLVQQQTQQGFGVAGHPSPGVTDTGVFQ